MRRIFVRVIEKEKKNMRISAALANQLIGKFMIHQAIKTEPKIVRFVDKTEQLRIIGISLNEITHMAHMKQIITGSAVLQDVLRDLITFLTQIGRSDYEKRRANKMPKKEKIQIRMTDEQYQIISEKAKRAKLSVSEYLRLAAEGDEVVIFEGMGDFRREIRKIETNLKQLEKLRDEGKFGMEGLDELKEQVDELWRLLSS